MIYLGAQCDNDIAGKELNSTEYQYIQCYLCVSLITYICTNIKRSY